MTTHKKSLLASQRGNVGRPLRTGCFRVVCVLAGLGALAGFDAPVLAAAGLQKNAAAARVEELYNGVPAGTDAEDREGYNAAQKAAEQLKLDFLAAFQNPQKSAANQTAWQEEEAQLISDSMKYGGDRTLDAVAMYWGVTQLHLPVISPEELLAQAKAMPVADQPGEREFNAYMAQYLAARFDALNKLAPHYHSATDDIDGRDVPLNLADLYAELRIDEVDRTMSKSGPPVTVGKDGPQN
jgi:hypothetical protein